MAGRADGAVAAWDRLRSHGASLVARPALPGDFEEASWVKLKEAIGAVHNQTAVTTPEEDKNRLVDAVGADGGHSEPIHTNTTQVRVT